MPTPSSASDHSSSCSISTSNNFCSNDEPSKASSLPVPILREIPLGLAIYEHLGYYEQPQSNERFLLLSSEQITATDEAIFSDSVADFPAGKSGMRSFVLK
jgi:hypothetical protein